ncbi:MAG TPA: MBL fold metallo-hydrolase [Verrucomicrobiae bacterium]
MITFPNGGIGVVDAHPSTLGSRAKIEQIIADKEIHFVCLTHPHDDHATDLAAVLRTGRVKQFWTSVSDISSLGYRVESFTNFPSPIQEFARSLNAKKAAVFLELFNAVHPAMTVNPSDNFAPITIDGVNIHFLSPSNAVIEEFRQSYFRRAENPTTREPDFNLLSIIIALEYSGVTILLGADALKQNWTTAIAKFRRLKLPKANILKVPHHGARNSIDLQKGQPSYVDLCSTKPQAKAVIFAGDKSHPNENVFQHLRSRLDVVCLANGLKGRNNNPLNLQLPGAKGNGPAPICNPQITFVISTDGTFTQTKGSQTCQSCGL